jgi:NAD(P)-dependent dehydrogenase (short-subunit alcohol dehydrogenase family)
MTRWTARDLPSQAGRTAIVTGASSGLGRATTAALAAAGTRVILAVRDVAKGRHVAAAIAGATEVRELDLADLGSVRRFAAGWTEAVDLLINNAGVMALPRRTETVDGFEMQLATNHLGHFALTNLLLPQISGRVVTVSSVGHRQGTIVLDDLNWERRRYRPWPAYGQSKLANLLFTLELQRRLDADRPGLRALAAHPGLASTNLFQHHNAWAQRIGSAGIKLLGQSEEAGALPTLYAATEDLPGASYVGPDGPGESRGGPTLVGRSIQAGDARLAQELWAKSEELTGVSYPA